MKLTPKQAQANELLAGSATHIMLWGGSRSGKTFLLVRAVCLRALKAPKSRHAIVRFRFNAVKSSVVLDTFPKVMDLCFPGVHYSLSKSDWFATFDNGSEIWFAGLDDKERTEKILGMEFATIYANECSQIPYGSIETAVTRLAQKAEQQAIGSLPAGPLRPRVYYDCVTGDTVLDGQSLSIAELAEIGTPIHVVTTHGKRVASAPWNNGIGTVFHVKTETGRTIKVTPSHRFFTPDGWRRLDEITIGQKLLCIDERRFCCDDPGAALLSKKAQDSAKSCYRYRHQCDEPPLREEVAGQVYPASSCDGEERSRLPFRHDEQDCRKAHHAQREALHIRHSQASHGLLSQLSGVRFLRRQALFGWQACGSFLRKRLFAGKSESESVHQRSKQERVPSDRQKDAISLSWQAASDCIAICMQWLRYSLVPTRFQGRKSLCSISASVDLLSRDIPLINNGSFETVVEITALPAVAYYTINVPFVNHYLAHGFVSHNCNPPSKAHWTYKLFREKRHPETRQALAKPDDYASMQINPVDNTENLADGYLDTLKSMSSRARRRFFDGEFADATPNALFPEEHIDRWRVTDGQVPDMVRVVVAVDPSGADDEDNADNDAIGIVVAGLGTDGNAYLGPDLTCKAGPATWGKVATDAYDRHEADAIVGETNFGGAMVQHVIQTCRPRTNFVKVSASRGKAQRAEPFSALYEQGKVRHVGYLSELEDELSGFSTYGYTGERSPNRADAAIWALAALFPGLVKPPAKPKKDVVRSVGWMG